MSRFTPLEEMLNEAWDDPKKREHLRKAVFERIAELEAEVERLKFAWVGADERAEAAEAKLARVEEAYEEILQTESGRLYMEKEAYKVSIKRLEAENEELRAMDEMYCKDSRAGG